MLCHYYIVSVYLMLVGAITVYAAPALPEVSNDTSNGFDTDVHVIVIRANSSQLHEVTRRITLILGATNNELINATIERNESGGWIIQAKECGICREKAFESEALDVGTIDESIQLKPVQPEELAEDVKITDSQLIIKEVISNDDKRDEGNNTLSPVGGIHEDVSQPTDKGDGKNCTDENSKDDSSILIKQHSDDKQNTDEVIHTDRKEHLELEKHEDEEKLTDREKQIDVGVYINKNNDIEREEENYRDKQITTERNAAEMNETEGRQQDEEEQMESGENKQGAEQKQGSEQLQHGKQGDNEENNKGREGHESGQQQNDGKHQQDEVQQRSEEQQQGGEHKSGEQHDVNQRQGAEQQEQGVTRQQSEEQKQSLQIQQSGEQQDVKQQQDAEQQQGGKQYFTGQKPERQGDNEQPQTKSGDHDNKEDGEITKSIHEKLEYRVEKHLDSPWIILLAVVGGLIGAYLMYSIAIKIWDRTQSAEYRIRE